MIALPGPLPRNLDNIKEWLEILQNFFLLIIVIKRNTLELTFTLFLNFF